MVETFTRKTKGKAKKKPKDMQPTRTKEGRKLVPFVVGSYLTHSTSNVTCMQIVRSNSNRRPRTTSPANTIFFSMAKIEACWRAILTHCLKNWMQRYKDKQPLDHLLWKRRAYSLIKQSISHLGALCTSMAIKIKWRPSWIPLYLWILTMVLKFHNCTCWLTNDTHSHCL